MVTTIAQLQGVLTLDDAQFKGGLNEAKGGMSSLGSGIQSAGVKMTKFGVGASLALTPVTLFLKSSIGAFREWDVAMTNSQTILGATNEEMEVLNAQVLEIGANSRAGPQAAADAYFTIVSGVQDATTHMDILNSSIALSEAGLADLAVTTAGMVAVMNAYEFAAEDASFVSDVFTRTVQMGVGTMDDFVAALTPLASLANTLGISFEELAGAEALLTSKGVSASEAATQLRSAMVAFIKPNADMVLALEAMGFASGSMAIETLGLQGAIDALSTALDDDVGAMSQALGRTEALNAALLLAGDGAEEFLDKFAGGVDGATEAARDLQNATDEAISDAFISKIDALKILVGLGLSGAIADVQKELIPFVDKIIEWAVENPETVKQMTFLTVGAIAAAAALTVLGIAIGVIASPVVLLAGGVALLIFALNELAIALGFADVFEMFETGMDNLVEIIRLSGVIIGGIFEAVKGAIINSIETSINIAIDAVNVLIFGFNKLSSVVGGPTIAAIDRLGTRVNNFDLDKFREIATTGVGQALLGGLGFLGFTSIEQQLLALPGLPSGLPGQAFGGDFDAMETIRVGEDGPETVTFPIAGTVNENNRRGEQPLIETVNVFANSFAEGQAAARGFDQELTALRRGEG